MLQMNPETYLHIVISMLISNSIYPLDSPFISLENSVLRHILVVIRFATIIATEEITATGRFMFFRLCCIV